VTSLTVEGVDVSHSRLVELTNLADQAQAFYEWVEERFQLALSRREPLGQILLTATAGEIKRAMLDCYKPSDSGKLPLLFDGVGRTYKHEKACYYFFSWIIRDAPQQRLGPLIGRILKNSKRKRVEIEVQVIASLICKYRSNVKTFSWEAVREVFVERLEGSRRSLQGHRKEAVVRTALLTAFQGYFTRHGGYGKFTSVKVADRQIAIGKQTFDVSAELSNERGQVIRRILVPVKTRETEGGGHAHLYSRDIAPAIAAIRNDNSDDYLVVIIGAQNWSVREAEEIRSKVDHVAVFEINPSAFSEFGSTEQQRLNNFVAAVLDGVLQPKL